MNRHRDREWHIVEVGHVLDARALLLNGRHGERIATLNAPNGETDRASVAVRHLFWNG